MHEQHMKDLDRLAPFLPLAERQALAYALRHSEEAAYIGQLVRDWNGKIAAMPRTYAQDGLGDAAIVHLHYFRGASDWYITERDKEGDGREQAFGYAVLNGDRACAELGYISIAELVQHGVELDLYWTACPLRQVKRDIAA